MIATPIARPPAPSRLSALMERTVVRAAIILLAGLFVYAPVIHGSWLMDDNIEVSQNAIVQGPGGLPKIWRGEATADYLPLKSTLFWLLWRVVGNHPAGYHLTSIALHLLSALLLWHLFQRLGMRHAWVGGLLFAVHPIMVESVSWVSELKNTLSLAVLLLVMLAWLNFDERRRWQDYASSITLFAAALLCKASVIMWPVVILLYCWWKRGRISRDDVRASVPFFAVSLAAGIVTVLLQGMRAIRGEVFPLGGFASRFALAGLNLSFYLRKIVFPAGLLPMYPRWRIEPPGAVEFLPWLVWLPLGYWLWTKRRLPWGRTALFGTGFFVINLAPVLGFVRMAFMRVA